MLPYEDNNQQLISKVIIYIDALYPGDLLKSSDTNFGNCG